MPAPVIAITNHKGGVGKTTTIVNLSAELGRLGYAVLVIDLDPQANASLHIGKKHPAELDFTASKLFFSSHDVLHKIIQEETNDGFDNVNLIYGSLDLSSTEDVLRDKSPRPYEELKSRIDALRSVYDIILIDCPPSLRLLTGNALAASDWYIVPVETTSQYPLYGMSDLKNFIDQIRNYVNPKLDLLGTLLTRHDERQRTCKVIGSTAEREVGKLLPVKIHTSTKVGQAAICSTTVRKIDRSSRVATDFADLASYVSKTLNLKRSASAISDEKSAQGQKTPKSPQLGSKRKGKSDD